MSLPDFDIYSGISKLRPKRRVGSGRDPEEFVPDASGVGTSNQPIPDAQGGVAPESYDVRANQVINPQQEQAEAAQQKNDSMLYTLGRSLADYVNPQKAQKNTESTRGLMDSVSNPQAPAPREPQMLSAGMGAPSAPQPQDSSGVFGAIRDYFSPEKRVEVSQRNSDLSQNAQLLAQGKDPEQVRSQVNDRFQQDVQKAQQQPFKSAAYGAADQVANHPALQAQFKQITGMDFKPELAAQVAEHEAAMQGVEDSLQGINTQLDERAEGIKQRILNNQSTEADKYYIGLALLMPLIMGGIFGKEAGLGALQGTAKGFGDIANRKQDEIRKDEESLLDIGKQQSSNQEKLANIGLEKAKLGPALRKALPEDPNKHLVGMRSIDWKDPNTGEQKQGVEIAPGFVAEPQYVNSEERVKNMQKAANELTDVKTYVDQVNDTTNEIVQIVSQLQDPNIFWKYFRSKMLGKNPSALSTLTQDVTINGRKQNAGVILEEKMGILQNLYARAQQLGQLDRAAQSHMKKLFDNPTSTLLTPEDARDQVLNIRDLAQQGLIKSARNKGFIPEFVIRPFEEANKELYDPLNQAADDKQAAEIKRKLMQSETNYAQ